MSIREAAGITLYVDGAAKGNPGPAGIGIRAEANGRVLAECCDYIGLATNNAAEYRALIRGLEVARRLRAETVRVVSDSELIVKQMNGVYRVKNPALQPLYRKARRLASAFRSFQIRHVPRSRNRYADRLANMGIAKSKSASGPDGRARKGEESPSSTGQDAG